jgi:RNA polymerase sigma factor (sigma-70 family)
MTQLPADFALWVQPHLTALSRYAGRRVAPEDRDDVVQETLIAAWQRWGTYDEARGTPVAWLLSIQAERCRLHRTRPRVVPDAPLVELVERDPQPGTWPDVDLGRAIDGLSRSQREAVDLHYFVGLDVPTVAEVMGWAPDTVTTTLRQARARLRQLVGDDDG